MSEITSETAQALKAKRHTQVQEATAETIRRDARNADTLSQLRCELQHDHLHAEAQSDEFQQSRIDTKIGTIEYRRGAQFRSLNEESGTANVGKLLQSSRRTTRHRRLNVSKISARNTLGSMLV